MTENDENADRAVSRRDVFKAGVMGTGLAAYASLGAEEVQADHTTPTEPLITLGDSFELFDDGDDAVIKHVPSGAHFTYNQAESRWEMDAPLHLQEADVVNETFVRGYLDSDITGITAGTWTNIIDTEEADGKDELNSSFVFTPSETAYYVISASVAIVPGADQDRLLFRLRNTSDNVNALFIETRSSGANREDMPLADVAELTAGKNYEFQANNPSSTYSITSGSDATRASVRKSVMHP